MIDVDSPALTIGVLGAGAMGAGIVQVALTAGVCVVLHDAVAGAAEKAKTGIFARLDRVVEKGEASGEAMAAAKARLRIAGGLADFAPCAAVIEAIVENLDVKRQVFTALEAIVAPDAILASNTSSLPIASIASACKARARIAGMHFFNPVPLMKLVEIIAGADTAPEVSDWLTRLGARLGRTPVRVKDAPGFLVNLGGRAYTTEALHILEEGVAAPEDIDAVMRDGLGFRMGPFELMDLTGIDVNYPVSRIVWDGYFQDPRLKSTPTHASLFQAGRLGRKTGAGFHRYDADGKKIAVAPAVLTGPLPARLVLPEADERIVALAVAAGVETHAGDDHMSPIVIAPVGEDCTTAALRLGVDPRRAVALDLLLDTAKRITVMSAPGADPATVAAVAAVVRAAGRHATVIKDSPGFIGQRIGAMVANLGCEMAQIGLASPADIDTAMRLGLSYPLGPIALADRFGTAVTFEILSRLQAITGSDRYRPSLWLRRRALLGVSASVV